MVEASCPGRLAVGLWLHGTEGPIGKDVIFCNLSLHYDNALRCCMARCWPPCLLAQMVAWEPSRVGQSGVVEGELGTGPALAT